MKYIIIILLIILIIFNIIKYNVEHYENINNIELVVARYNENIDWFKLPEFSNFKIICYNKGNEIKETFPNVKIINLKNVGKCDHTYLYHIINNYNNLSNVTIFLPGSWRDNHKILYSTNLINKTIETNNTVFIGPYTDNLYKNLYNFYLDEWETTNLDNKLLNNEKKLLLSNIRPYGKWYEQMFNINNNIKIITYLSIFSVHKNHITQHSKEYYQKFLNLLNFHSNPEVGHYIERSWGAIFYPYPDKCLFY